MRCPSCFVPLDPNRFTFLLSTGERETDTQASRFAGAQVTNFGSVTVLRPADAKRDWRPDPRSIKPDITGPVHEACPNCHYRLPDGIRSASVICIAMSGARTTGKSLYIAVAVQQLRRYVQTLGSVLEPANRRTAEIYTESYERPLYVERGLLGPTAALFATNEPRYQREPLVWSLGLIRGRRHFLAIRDIAGEDMEGSIDDSPVFAFLRHAQTVFFMFDPLAIESVRRKLQDLIPSQILSNARPQDVLANLLRLLGDGGGSRLAVIVSKFDALQALVDVDDVTWRSIMSNTGAAFMRDESEVTPSYDAQDGELLSEEVRSLLHALDAQEISLALSNPTSGRPIEHRFFAVSVLGAPPEGRELNRHGILPFRCLDPLKWTLFEERVIAGR